VIPFFALFVGLFWCPSLSSFARNTTSEVVERRHHEYRQCHHWHHHYWHHHYWHHHYWHHGNPPLEESARIISELPVTSDGLRELLVKLERERKARGVAGDPYDAPKYSYSDEELLAQINAAIRKLAELEGKTRSKRHSISKTNPPEAPK